MTRGEDRTAEDVLDRQLVKRIAQSRDREAFALLFAKVAPRIKSYMLRKGVSPEQSEDLVQEAMLMLWRKAGLYDPGKGAVTTWIFTIVRNLRIDRLRRESSMPLAGLEDYDEISDEPGSDDVLASKQEQEHVARALREIPPEQREILLLSYVEDIPQSEIAERLKLPLGTVKSRMRLAYSRLRRSLEAIA